MKPLTPREKEVLEFIRMGLLAKQIAGHLGISVRTVDAHYANIREKAGVTKTRDALKVYSP